MLNCDVCGRPALGVACSSVGGISYAYCEECLKNFAEPLSAFEFWHETLGDDVADWVKEVTTYINGEYVSYVDWIKSK